MKTFKCTATGLIIYKYFVKLDGVFSTDPKFKNYFLDMPFSNPNDVEEIIIKLAVKIRKEQEINKSIENEKDTINPDTDWFIEHA